MWTMRWIKHCIFSNRQIFQNRNLFSNLQNMIINTWCFSLQISAKENQTFGFQINNLIWNSVFLFVKRETRKFNRLLYEEMG